MIGRGYMAAFRRRSARIRRAVLAGLYIGLAAAGDVACSRSKPVIAPTEPIAASALSEPGLTEAQRTLNVESFDAAWETIRDRHWDPELGGLDWPAVRDELRPRVAQADSMAEARAVMGEMIERLDQSHFAVIPKVVYEAVHPSDTRSRQDGEAGIDVRVIDGEALVTAVRADSPAAELGVRPGWRLDRIGDEPVASILGTVASGYLDKPSGRFMLARAVMSHLAGKPGDRVPVSFDDGRGQRVTLDVPLVKRRGNRFEAMNLPPHYVWIEWRRLRGDIGYIAFNYFLDPAKVMPAFGEAVEAFMDARGVIIDLRGNHGGLGAMVMGMAGWFIDRSDVYLGTMYMRDAELKFVVGARWQTFDGPVAILVDGLSVSTAEILAGGMRDVGRARLFGTPTAAAALPSMIVRLPNGDGLQYVHANYVSASGVTLEGNGVQPDVEIRTTRGDLLAGRDPVVEAAVAWIDEERRGP